MATYINPAHPQKRAPGAIYIYIYTPHMAAAYRYRLAALFCKAAPKCHIYIYTAHTPANIPYIYVPHASK